jgi:DNA-binding transcriptional ArsR family regulator
VTKAASKRAKTAPVFAALGDETRLHIVARLCREGPLPTVRLTDGSNISRQAIAKHLNALSKAGLVRSERTGRERMWKLEVNQFAQAGRYLEQISREWDEALGRLRALVESD